MLRRIRKLEDMQNTVIGPINLDDWYWMRQLRESIKHAKAVNPIKYKQLIDMHSKFYKEELKRVVSSG